MNDTLLRINKLFKKRWGLFTLLIINSIIHFRWLSFNTFSFSDWGSSYYSDSLRTKILPFLWTMSRFEAGWHDAFVWRYPVDFAFSLFAQFNLNSNISEKFLVFLPGTIGTAIAGYILTKKFTKTEISALLGGIITSLNTYNLASNAVGHIMLTAAACFGILAIYFYAEFYDSWVVSKSYFSRKTIFYILLTSVLLFITGSYDLRMLYMTSFLIFLYFLVYFPYNSIFEKVFRKKIISLFLLNSLLGFLILIFNLYWILGFAFTKPDPSFNVFQRGLFGSEFFDLLSAFNLHHPFWNNSELDWFIKADIPIWSYAVSILFVFGLLTAIKNKFVIYFGLAGLIGVILSKQIDDPLPDLYLFLFENIPGFSAFREASKFYFISTVGYAVVISNFLNIIINYLNEKQEIFYKLTSKVVISIFIFLPFLLNTIVIFTGEVGALYTPREIHKDYSIVDKYIQNQDGFFRVMWYPAISRWVNHTNEKPQISANQLFLGKYSQFSNKERKINTQLITNEDRTDKIIEPFEKGYAKTIVNWLDIKYIAVPRVDVSKSDDILLSFGGSIDTFIEVLNKEDWLEEVNLGTEDIVLFKNKDYENISKNNSLNPFFLESERNIQEKTTVMSNISKSDNINFLVENEYVDFDYKPNKMNYLADLFDKFTLDNITSNNTIINSNYRQGNFNLYKNKNSKKLYYELYNKKLTLYSEDPVLKIINDKEETIIGETNKTIYFEEELKNYDQLYLNFNQEIINIQEGQFYLGELERLKNLEIIAETGENLINNGDFEEGLWQDKVGSCHAFDNNPILEQEIETNFVLGGRNSLRLSAARQVACVKKNINIYEPGNYLFKINYASKNKGVPGFNISSTNGKNFLGQVSDEVSKNFVGRTLPLKPNEKWSSHIEKINFELSGDYNTYLYSYSENNPSLKKTVYYDNIGLTKIDTIFKADFSTKETILNNENILIDIKEGSKVEYLAKGLDFSNILENYNFEQGPWQDAVGNCYAFDNNPQISMNLNKEDFTSGNQSLELKATRHIACTSQEFSLKRNSKLYFSFDYKTNRRDGAGYVVAFNDPDNTVYSDRLGTGKNTWDSVTREINVPLNATGGRVIIYGYQTNLTNETTTLYDNFKLINYPEIENSYFFYNNLQIKNNNFEFNKINNNPIKTVYEIKNLKNDSFLSFKDNYTPNFDYYIIEPDKKFDIFNSFIFPSFHDTFKIEEKLRLNSGINGIFFDLEKNCKGNNLCQQNSDGTYNFKLVAHYTPQKYLNIGLVISSISFFITLIGIAYLYIKSKPTNPKSSKTNPQPTPTPPPKTDLSDLQEKLDKMEQPVADLDGLKVEQKAESKEGETESKKQKAKSRKQKGERKKEKGKRKK